MITSVLFFCVYVCMCVLFPGCYRLDASEISHVRFLTVLSFDFLLQLYYYICILAVTEEEVIIQDGHVKAMEKMDLGFNGIYMELAAKKKKKSRVILDGSIRGRARPGRMLAIMGPSGGKLNCYLFLGSSVIVLGK
jgi:hypothetical protein